MHHNERFQMFVNFINTEIPVPDMVPLLPATIPLITLRIKKTKVEWINTHVNFYDY